PICVLIRNQQTITVDSGGALTVGAASVAIEDFQSGTVEGIVVNGVMSATGASFTRSNGGLNQNDNSQITVNLGGRLAAINSTFAWDNVSLNGSSTDALQFSIFATQLAINSGALITITGN